MPGPVTLEICLVELIEHAVVAIDYKDVPVTVAVRSTFYQCIGGNGVWTRVAFVSILK